MYSAFRVPCCDVRCDFHIVAVLTSSLPPVVCRRAHSLCCLCLLDCLSGVQHILCCLDCPFLIAPSVFSSVCSINILKN